MKKVIFALSLFIGLNGFGQDTCTINVESFGVEHKFNGQEDVLKSSMTMTPGSYQAQKLELPAKGWMNFGYEAAYVMNATVCNAKLNSGSICEKELMRLAIADYENDATYMAPDTEWAVLTVPKGASITYEVEKGIFITADCE